MPVALSTLIATSVAAVASVFAVVRVALLPLPEALDAVVEIASMRAAFASDDPVDALKDLFDWERERVASAAKGLASTAAGLVIALVPGFLSHGVGGEAPAVIIVVAGVGILLILAIRSAASARRLSDELVFAYALRRKLEKS